MKKIKDILFVLVITACLGYVAICLFMYQQQRSILYQPKLEKTSPQDVGAQGAEIVRVRTNDNLTLEGWYFAPSSPNNKTIVFFHGNGWNIGDSFTLTKDYLKHGFGLLMVEYRGYAGHNGRVSEQGLYKDARAYINWLHEEKGVPHSDMIFYGESLGSSLAVKMASEYKAFAVILLAPFTSMIDVAKEYYPLLPVSILLRDTYLNDKAIKKVASPILFLHGDQDKLVNIKFGKALYDAANDPKKIVIFEEGTHVNLYALGAHKVIREFLEDIDQKQIGAVTVE